MLISVRLWVLAFQTLTVFPISFELNSEILWFLDFLATSEFQFIIGKVNEMKIVHSILFVNLIKFLKWVYYTKLLYAKLL